MYVKKWGNSHSITNTKKGEDFKKEKRETQMKGTDDLS